MTLPDFTAIWNAGGPVAVGFALVAAAFFYDRRKPEAKQEKDDMAGALREISRDLKDLRHEFTGLRHECTDRLARAETRLDSHQHQIDRKGP